MTDEHKKTERYARLSSLLAPRVVASRQLLRIIVRVVHLARGAKQVAERDRYSAESRAQRRDERGFWSPFENGVIWSASRRSEGCIPMWFDEEGERLTRDERSAAGGGVATHHVRSRVYHASREDLAGRGGAGPQVRVGREGRAKERGSSAAESRAASARAGVETGRWRERGSAAWDAHYTRRAHLRGLADLKAECIHRGHDAHQASVLPLHVQTGLWRRGDGGACLLVEPKGWHEPCASRIVVVPAAP
eukprot:scaffold52344_cov281-Isochrysis_galbana.AAC.1